MYAVTVYFEDFADAHNYVSKITDTIENGPAENQIIDVSQVFEE